MERVLSDEEKLRRAIEISQRRNNGYRNENIRIENVKDNKKEYKLFKRMLIQIIICLLVYSIFYLVSNKNFIFSSEIINKTNSILNYDINFKEFYQKSKNSINSFIDKWKIQNEVANADENIKKEEIVEINNTNVEEDDKEGNVEEQKDDNISKTQEEIDVEFLKNNYNFIKPISGKITSKFGVREVLISGMTSDHKGIDISAKQGTKIEAAIDGQVEEASYNSQYGNFIKLKKDDVLTLYAHCKSLKVSKGEEIKQGDVIATVGSTGLATGPHLHFEIRLNNRYINPESIIQW